MVDVLELKFSHVLSSAVIDSAFAKIAKIKRSLKFHGLQYLLFEGLMVTSVLKPTDMTIHWKALEEHFPMVPLVF
jgi:hypothetical protein